MTDLSKVKKIAPLIPFDCEDDCNLAAPPGTVTKLTSENGKKYHFL